MTTRGQQGWEPLWADLDSLPTYWRTAEPAVVAWAESLRDAGAHRVLDLGCGIGRHTVALASLGLTVAASDVSPSGLATCAAWLAREHLTATLACHEMATFPFPDSAFDGLVAYHVIYHTTMAGMRRVLAETRRVLCPGGRLYFTAIPRHGSRIAEHWANVETGACREIEPFTFVYPADHGDRRLPHHHSDEAELRSMLSGFSVDDLSLVQRTFTDDDGSSQTSVHYHIRARRV